MNKSEDNKMVLNQHVIEIGTILLVSKASQTLLYDAIGKQVRST